MKEEVDKRWGDGSNIGKNLFHFLNSKWNLLLTLPISFTNANPKKPFTMDPKIICFTQFQIFLSLQSICQKQKQPHQTFNILYMNKNVIIHNIINNFYPIIKTDHRKYYTVFNEWTFLWLVIFWIGFKW